MTDIVAELRARAQQGRFNLEAADEIERLRAELSEQCRLLGMSAEREAKHLAQIAALEKERDALRAELDALKSQEPVAWLIDWADEPDLGHYFSESAVDEDSGRSRPLFLHPVPASVPEGWQLVPIEPTQEMLDATSWPNCAGTDYKKMLAAAPRPEAKP